MDHMLTVEVSDMSEQPDFFRALATAAMNGVIPETVTTGSPHFKVVGGDATTWHVAKALFLEGFVFITINNVPVEVRDLQEGTLSKYLTRRRIQKPIPTEATVIPYKEGLGE